MDIIKEFETEVYDNYQDGWADSDLSDFISNCIDRAFPIYTNDIIDAWKSAGYPEPSELNDTISGSINLALVEYIYQNINIEDIQRDAYEHLTDKFDFELGEFDELEDDPEFRHTVIIALADRAKNVVA